MKQAYRNILKVAKHLLAQVEQEELRFTLTREDKSNSLRNVVLHEWVTPLLYLRLESHTDGIFAIHYGFEQVNSDDKLSNIAALFTRCIYNLTAKHVTSVNIEESVKVDWCITNPSAMYEFIEERNKYHTFALIKHRVTTSERKRMLSVA